MSSTIIEENNEKHKKYDHQNMSTNATNAWHALNSSNNNRVAISQIHNRIQNHLLCKCDIMIMVANDIYAWNIV